MFVSDDPEGFRATIWSPDLTDPAREGLRLDFKQQFGKQRDAALDVAAFANGDGGAILYGVEEGPGSDGYKVAAGLVPIDVDDTKQQVEAAMARWLCGLDVRPEPFALTIMPGHSVLVVNVRASPSLVAVLAEAEKREGLVYAKRTTHGNEYMAAEEVERRILGYPARAMRLRLRNVFGGDEPSEPQRVKIAYIEPGTPGDQQRPVPWDNDVYLVRLTEFAAVLAFKHNVKTFSLEVPYEWIGSIWQWPVRRVDEVETDRGPQRVWTGEYTSIPALMVRADLKFEDNPVVGVRAIPMLW